MKKTIKQIKKQEKFISRLIIIVSITIGVLTALVFAGLFDFF